MRALLAVMCLVALGIVAGAAGQADLSGTWLVVPERSVWKWPDGRVQHIRVFGDTFLASHTPDALTLVLEDVPLRYPLDGHAHVVPHPGPGGLEPVRVVAGWVGERLEIAMQSLSDTAESTRGRTNRSLLLQPDGTLFVTAPWGQDGQPIGTVYRRSH